MRVGYLCRGMGWAHAARGALVLPRLRRTPGIDAVELAACGAAVEHFDLAGLAHHDLRVPDELDHSGYAAHRIRTHLDAGARPDVVFSDELCFAPLVCRAMGVPSVLMVCSFRHYRECPPAFAAADRILLANWPAVSEIPEALRHKVTAIGPIVRRERDDQPTARASLGLPHGAFVATASFGNLHPTKRAYFASALSQLLRAWQHAPESAVLVIPLAAATVHELTGLSVPAAGVRCVGPTPRMNDYHLASDVVLTVGGSTTSHAVRNATPTVVLAPPTGLDRPPQRDLPREGDAAGDDHDRSRTAGGVAPPDDPPHSGAHTPTSALGQR